MKEYKVGARLFCIDENEGAEHVRPTKNRWFTVTEPLGWHGKKWKQYVGRFDHMPSASIFVGAHEIRDRRLLVLLP